MNPDVDAARVLLVLAYLVGNIAAADSVLYPETAYLLVGIGKRKAAGLGMREG